MNCQDEQGRGNLGIKERKGGEEMSTETVCRKLRRIASVGLKRGAFTGRRKKGETERKPKGTLVYVGSPPENEKGKTLRVKAGGRKKKSDIEYKKEDRR